MFVRVGYQNKPLSPLDGRALLAARAALPDMKRHKRRGLSAAAQN